MEAITLPSGGQKFLTVISGRMLLPRIRAMTTLRAAVFKKSVTYPSPPRLQHLGLELSPNFQETFENDQRKRIQQHCEPPVTSALVVG